MKSNFIVGGSTVQGEIDKNDPISARLKKLNKNIQKKIFNY